MTRDTTRHGIRNRILFSMGQTVLLGVLGTGFVFAVAATTIQTLADQTAELDSMADSLHSLQASLASQETLVLDYALTLDDAVIEAFDDATYAVLLAYVDLRTSAVGNADLLASVDAVNETATTWREEWAEPFLRAIDAERTTGVAAVDDSKALLVPVKAALSDLEAQLELQRGTTAEQVGSAIPDLVTVVLPFGAVIAGLLVLVGLWLTHSISAPLQRLNGSARAMVAGEAVTFVAERDDEVGALAEVLDQLRVDVGERYESARREGLHAATFNQLAELTSFASDEQDLVHAAGHALRRLVVADRGDVLLANPSQNRLTVGTAWGTDAPEGGTLVRVDRIDECPGIRRSSAYVADDLSDPMAVRCAAHPAESGTVACVPMSALGKMVGVLHLEDPTPAAFDPESLRLVTRVAETVGLALANARLMKTMEGQAMTDALTGLRNARFFDPYLTQELEAAERDKQPISVVMLDIDHFKEFNDTHGHPAGDEALRTFARVLGGSIRTSDVAARYGGEEFIVALRHAGIGEARLIGEKIRQAVEQMVIELGPGRYGRLTASIGIASTETHITDMRALVSLADAALYRAKEAGRNRVEVALPIGDVSTIAARRRRNGSDIPAEPGEILPA